ncbi:MAG: hypothetical protein ACOX4F_07035 [Atopobiaceae bacterium]|jgi:hypothetical protein
MDINLKSAADGLDASDARLVEALKEGLSHGRFEVGVDAPAEEPPAQVPPAGEFTEVPTKAKVPSDLASSAQSATGRSAQDSSHDEDRAAQHEMAFLQALNAFRAAKKSQDPEAMRAAERRLQEVTRAELEEFEAARTQQEV